MDSFEKLTRDILIECGAEHFEKCLGAYLGRGGQGVVFELKDEPDKVVKISNKPVYYNELNSFESKLEQELKIISSTLDKVKKLNCSSIVKVYDHGLVGIHPKRNCFLYYTLMEKLEKTTAPERDWLYKIHCIAAYERNAIALDQAKECLKKLPVSSKEYPLYFKFLIDSVNIPFSHYDSYIENIMKDKSGYYKYIDLESIALRHPTTFQLILAA